ncbi:transcription intermediary factor 1-beta-like [Pecten maximus]|uniref:transcription intermediary factor 1-beta-like n=1 Tax=Pecten maximus TaxID=6579 RepID=UPI00145870BF|nr:transcription intermediary factor 1-beta-like [Pecten maximus]XP_033730078.1 transcription intermediary factor 1-beta-like [Pecten maximus]
MAEGGHPPELDIHLLECPICLERLQKPKSLPCLHCFCQECLGTYITKELSGKMASETSFPCPVCRRVTPPVNPVDSKDKWADQFPTNAVIQDLIQLKERSSEPLYCKPCQKKGNMTNPAQFWCKDMAVNFCDDCKVQFHDILHNECGILDISGYGNNRTNLEKSVPRCDQHDKKKVWYCEDHQLLGCSICMLEFHRCCEEVTTAMKYFQRLKDGSQLADMQDSLKKNADVIDIIVKDFDEQLQNLVQNQETALQSITDLRQKVDKRLNTLQKDVTDKLIASFKEEKRNMESSLRQCERLMNSMLNTMKSSVTAVEGNDHIETIVLYQRGHAEVESCKALITDMRKSYTSVRIKHHVTNEHGNLDDDAMGKIIIEKHSRRLRGNHGDLEPPLLEREVKEIGKFNIKIPSDKDNCCARGVVYLPCDQIVVSDYNNKKLKLFTDKGQLLDELSIRGRPNDLCLVDNNTVAVAVSGPGGIHVVKVEASKLSMSSEIRMSNGEDCYGITRTDGRFIVGTYGGGVYSVTQDGVADLLHQYNSTCWSLTHDSVKGDTLVSVYSDTMGDVVVSRLSADKRHTDVMKVGVVSRPRVIDVDREGNIYVCGYKSHNVVQMSGDGTHVRELLSSDGIKYPWAISINGNRFVVTRHLNSFRGEDEDNYIRVFQLY